MACKKIDADIIPETYQREEAEKNLTFNGFFVLENKLKPDTISEMIKLNSADLKNVMVTGDHPVTAIHVAKHCELFPKNAKIRLFDVHSTQSGVSLVQKLMDKKPREFSDNVDVLFSNNPRNQFAITGTAWKYILESRIQYLNNILEKTKVFARFSPAQKTELVTLFQNYEGRVTGMCGDGANDWYFYFGFCQFCPNSSIT